VPSRRLTTLFDPNARHEDPSDTGIAQQHLELKSRSTRFVDVCSDVSGATRRSSVGRRRATAALRLHSSRRAAFIRTDSLRLRDTARRSYAKRPSYKFGRASKVIARREGPAAFRVTEMLYDLSICAIVRTTLLTVNTRFEPC
jgi:hypothetical protein